MSSPMPMATSQTARTGRATGGGHQAAASAPRWSGRRAPRPGWRPGTSLRAPNHRKTIAERDPQERQPVLRHPSGDPPVDAVEPARRRRDHRRDLLMFVRPRCSTQRRRAAAASGRRRSRACAARRTRRAPRRPAGPAAAGPPPPGAASRRRSPAPSRSASHRPATSRSCASPRPSAGRTRVSYRSSVCARAEEVPARPDVGDRVEAEAGLVDGRAAAGPPAIIWRISASTMSFSNEAVSPPSSQPAPW